MPCKVTLFYVITSVSFLRHITYEKSHRILCKDTLRRKNYCSIEEIRSYGKTLFIKNIVEIGQRGGDASPANFNKFWIRLCLQHRSDISILRYIPVVSNTAKDDKGLQIDSTQQTENLITLILPLTLPLILTLT